jgi:hypothetical protein
MQSGDDYPPHVMFEIFIVGEDMRLVGGAEVPVWLIRLGFEDSYTHHFVKKN